MLFLGANSSQTELITGADGNAVLEIDFEHLLAVDLAALFVAQSGHDGFGFRVDDFSRGGQSKSAVEAESDPAGLLAELDAGGLARGHNGGIENVHAAVGGVTHPDFFFIWSQSNAVARAAMALRQSLLEPLHFNPIQFLARG